MEMSEKEWRDLEADIDRSIRYHKARERFFQSWSSAFAFLTLISGSAVVVTLLAATPEWMALAFGAVVAGASALELVGGLARKGRLHASFASDFSAVQTAIILVEERDVDTWRRLRARIAELEMNEPPIMRWLDIACHNQVAFSRGSEDIYHIPWLQRRALQWIDLYEPQPKRSEG